MNYHKRGLECVYQLHEGAINGLAVGGGLVVTASDDKLLRVWCASSQRRAAPGTAHALLMIRIVSYALRSSPARFGRC